MDELKLVVEKSTLHNQVSNEQLARFMAQQSSAPGSLIWDKRKTTKISQKHQKIRKIDPKNKIFLRKLSEFSQNSQNFRMKIDKNHKKELN